MSIILPVTGGTSREVAVPVAGARGPPRSEAVNHGISDSPYTMSSSHSPPTAHSPYRCSADVYVQYGTEW